MLNERKNSHTYNLNKYKKIIKIILSLKVILERGKKNQKTSNKKTIFGSDYVYEQPKDIVTANTKINPCKS